MIDGEKLVLVMPFRASTAGMPIIAERGGVIKSLAHFEKLQALAVTRGGFAVTLKAGDWVTIPSLWWHAAFNSVATVSINNSVITAERAAEIFFNAALLGIRRQNGQDVRLRHTATMTLCPGLLRVMHLAAEEMFPGRGFTIVDGKVTPGDKFSPHFGVDASEGARDVDDVASWGAWLGLFSAGIQLLAQNAAGTGKRSGTKGNRTEMNFGGIHRTNRDALLRWINSMNGPTSSSVYQRRARGEVENTLEEEEEEATLTEKSRKRQRRQR